MIRRHPRSTRTDSLYPYTTLFRSAGGLTSPFTSVRLQPLRPNWLKRSAEVDLRQVLARVRPFLRTEAQTSIDGTEFSRWRRRLGLFGVVDTDGFVVLSRDRKSVCRERVCQYV